MIRIIVTQLILFALPFIFYFAYRVATRGATGAAVSDLSKAMFTLIVIGGLLVIASFAYFAVHGVNTEGRYIPARYVDGKLIPGHYETDN
ncbi:hypothetical protein DLJ53_07635 [Acuticoccus sediminis]|uniref:Uncharacterized protein n=1 Tax=Acuticoccus sediminis TaxID=2184697 RepID=A0A8B2P1H0_9HYPH|nr:DUF6111 family protein [Acuticoccus sediminis]RAI04305.1 hypothetical protein DLJ53_07635 [Acuticoccus sediminis]